MSLTFKTLIRTAAVAAFVAAGSIGALLLVLLVAHWTARIVSDADYQRISTLLTEQARQ